MINLEEIKNNLKSVQIGKRIFFYENIDSTNSEAQRLIDSSNAKFGDLIVAKTQCSGKGQQGNSWSSPEGGVYISIITVSKGSEFSNLITFAAGIACVDAVFSVAAIKTDLKWVNDVMYKGNKLGGILTQSATRGNLSTNITGIGINANAVITNISNKNKYKATSLTELLGQEININLLIAEICNYFEKYFNLYQKRPDLIVKKWQKYSNIKDIIVNFEVECKELSGSAWGVDQMGHLIVVADYKEYKLTSTKNVEIVYKTVQIT